MKGTIFSDDEGFEERFASALKTRYKFVLQEEHDNRQYALSYYDPAGALQHSDDWCLRIIIHIANRSIADAVITGRRDKHVHGATDCIMLGATLSN